MSEQQPACKNCRFWFQQAWKKDAGHCRRHAPTRDAQGIFSWCLILAEEWCGDYEPRQQGAEK